MPVSKLADATYRFAAKEICRSCPLLGETLGRAEAIGEEVCGNAGGRVRNVAARQESSVANGRVDCGVPLHASC